MKRILAIMLILIYTLSDFVSVQAETIEEPVPFITEEVPVKILFIRLCDVSYHI